MPAHRRQWIVLILSGIFPGLGQLYLRAWSKGGAFLIAGVVAIWALAQLVAPQDLLAGVVPNPLSALGVVLVLLALYFWSIADAWIAAR